MLNRVAHIFILSPLYLLFIYIYNN
ncbi:hypothetical protein IM043_gp004 [Bacillus phage SPG24]|nr:hypothetical protein IM043_gp004 [Bacillus phage SPG24]